MNEHKPRYKPLIVNSENCFGPVVTCPVCGFDYTHFTGKIELDPAGDADYRFWNGGCRGGGVRIGMWCEDGHTFDLCIAQHKGMVFLQTDGETEGIMSDFCDPTCIDEAKEN